MWETVDHAYWGDTYVVVIGNYTLRVYKMADGWTWSGLGGPYVGKLFNSADEAKADVLDQLKQRTRRELAHWQATADALTAVTQ